MKAINFLTRLSRDLNVKSPHDLTADARLEILDAINGAIQRIDPHGGSHNRTTIGAFSAPAPVEVSIGVTPGSVDITGHTFTDDDYGKTIRVTGDGVDNQITGETSLLHPYGGDTAATVAATVYGDAIPMPEPYAELIDDPRIIELNRRLAHGRCDTSLNVLKESSWPRLYWVEPNAGNNNPVSRAVIRLYPMPDQAYRFEAKVSLAPVRIKFTDLLSPGGSLPVREDHVENYLLPIARMLLTHSELWRNDMTKAAAVTAGEAAEKRFMVLAPSFQVTPNNQVGTPYGF